MSGNHPGVCQLTPLLHTSIARAQVSFRLLLYSLACKNEEHLHQTQNDQRRVQHFSPDNRQGQLEGYKGCPKVRQGKNVFATRSSACDCSGLVAKNG